MPTDTTLPAWATEFRASLERGFADVVGRLDKLELSLDTQSSTVNDVARRLSALETRVGEVEDRQDAHSVKTLEMKARAEAVDKAHEAAIATLSGKVDALVTSQERQLAILEKLEKGASALFGNPMVRSVLTMLGTAILTWLASKGIK